jgi:MSHA biogenesis protein MshL
MNLMPKSILLLFTSLILFSACGEKMTALKTSNVDNAFSNPETKTSLPPPAVTEALTPNFNQSLLRDTRAVRSGTFNISVHDVDARDFFMSIVADSKENMVVHPDVSGRITLELKNVTVPQVLNTVQKAYGYDYAKTDIGYIIYPATLQTKIFKIDRLDLLREGSSNTRVSSGQVNNGQKNINPIYPALGYQSGGNQQGGSPSQGNYGNTTTTGSWINTSSKTDFWEELQASLAAIVNVTHSAENANEMSNPKTGSKVVINKQTGIVVIRAQPGQMRDAEKLIATTQGQIGRQVAIEAKILEVTLNDNHKDGINWSNVLINAQKAAIASVNPISSVAPITNLTTGITSTTEGFTLGIKSGDFYTFIQLLEGQGKTNILSSPRISTLNNQKAVIKVGQDEYFITDVSSNTTASTTTTIAQNVTWTPFFSGIALDVTPQIADNNHITMHIHPSVTRVSDQVKDVTINGQNNQYPMALNVVRESDSVVNAESGQIIVIGGLMQVNIDENQQGVSMLTRIPYLGNAFRQNTGTGIKSELVILLKPTIIYNNDDWEVPLENSREHLQELERRPLWK